MLKETRSESDCARAQIRNSWTNPCPFSHPVQQTQDCIADLAARMTVQRAFSVADMLGRVVECTGAREKADAEATAAASRIARSMGEAGVVGSGVIGT